MVYDLIIIGGGPAGIAATIYAARKQLKTLFITSGFGGQSIVSPDIQNWIGVPSITGTGLAEMLKKHVEMHVGEFLEIQEGKVVNIAKNEFFTVTTDSAHSYESKTILVATGSRRKKLAVPGADLFENKGISYCASCDGPLFAGQDVAVIGGGNAAFETAAQLLMYAKSVTILHHGEKIKADEITMEAVLAHSNVKLILNAETAEIKGNSFVEQLAYTDAKTNEIKELNVAGIFVEIGQIPNTDFMNGLVELDQYKRIIVNPKNQMSSLPGIWAAGDCADGLYHQNNIAAGDGVKALEDLYLYLKTKKQ